MRNKNTNKITNTPKHNLYIVKVYNNNSKPLIKLGYSSNIEKRLKQYSDHNPLIELIGTFYREDAKEFENNFHKEHKSIELHEWYSYDNLRYIINKIENNLGEVFISNDDKNMTIQTTSFVNYVYKWQFTFDNDYKVTEDKKIINTKTNRILKECLNNCSIGYWFGRKFIPKNQLNKLVEKINI